MENTNGKEPAFPHEDIEYDGNDQYKIIRNGLTKREYFAAMCLQGILANPSPEIMQSEIPLENMAVQLADALLTQLNNK